MKLTRQSQLRIAANVVLFSMVNMSIPYAAFAASQREQNAVTDLPVPGTEELQNAALTLGMGVSQALYRNAGVDSDIMISTAFSVFASKVHAEAFNAQLHKPSKVSRTLSLTEMSTLKGRSTPARNPYVSGSTKWGVVMNGVDVLTGNLSLSATDLSFEGGYGIPVSVTRSYSANNADEGPFGYGWTLSVDIRTTAGGLLKSASAPVRSTPSHLRERPDGQQIQIDSPVEAVMTTDASGQETEVQKDLDGVLSPPSWDLNVHETQYESYTENGEIRQKVETDTVTTPEGTVYVYGAHGEYPDGIRPYFTYEAPNSSGHEQESNVLKINSVTDRHGNQTTYTYSGQATFIRGNRLVNEDKLSAIQMPNGYRLEFTWSGNRIVEAKDVSGGSLRRTVTYTYNTYDYGWGTEDKELVSVSSPMGRVTSYEYSKFNPENETIGAEAIYVAPRILSKVTDPRGLVTEYEHIGSGGEEGVSEGYHYRWPYFDSSKPLSIYTYKVKLPNGLIQEVGPGNGAPSNSTLPQEFLRSVSLKLASGEVIDNLQLHLKAANFSSQFSPLSDAPTYEGTAPQSNQVVQYSIARASTAWCVNTKCFDITNQQLLCDMSTSLLSGTSSPAIASSVDQGKRQTVTTANYNFQGNKLSETAKVFQATSGQSNLEYSAKTEYAYWGADKYYQQKAVKDPGGRFSFTDYYDKDQSIGSKGQTKAVYRTGLDSARSNEFSIPPNTNWKTTISVSAPTTVDGPYTGGVQIPSAYFKYDAHGRAIEVNKLQSISGTGSSLTPTYTKTVSAYGDGDAPTFGNATYVTEAYGTNSARTTTTLEYDTVGRALKVQDANGRIIQTTYNADGQVTLVERVDAALQGVLAEYTYGATGILTGVPVAVDTYDLISGEAVSQTFTYFNVASDKFRYGQPKAIGQYVLGAQSHVEYDYWPTGERKSATRYDSEGQVDSWQYDDYVGVGLELGKRVFQTLRRGTMGTGSTFVASKEEMHYTYAPSGQMLTSYFAQTPSGTAAYNGSYYRQAGSNNSTVSKPAASRARADYLYDGGGRIMELVYSWDSLNANGTSYTNAPMKKVAYDYTSSSDAAGAVPGMRKRAWFSDYVSGAWQSQYNEEYAYDLNLDYLKKTKYNEGTTTTDEWTYDAAANRITGPNQTCAFDELNRITSRVQNGVTRSYEHDPVGNRTSESWSAAPQAGTRSYTYDWDEFNRLRGIAGQRTGSSGGNSWVADAWSESSMYRADGLRARRVYGNTSNFEELSGFYDYNQLVNNATWGYYYDGQMLAWEDFTTYGEGNSLTIKDLTSYGLGARGIDVMIARRVSSDQSNDPLLSSSGLDTAVLGATSKDRVSFPLYDGHGNTIATLARNGTGYSIANVKRYDVWGKVRSDSSVGSSGQILNPTQKYCGNLGHKYDATSGLTYMRARYYEAETGRFISEDPARDGANWYNYGDNDTVQAVDFTGKWLHILLGAVLGGITAGIGGYVAHQDGWQLTWTIVVGVVAGAAAAASGAWIAGLLKGSLGVVAGGGAGGALSNFMNTLFDEVRSGHAVNWGRVGRAIGIGGVLGIAFGAIGASSARNGEIAAAIAAIDGDLWGSATDSTIQAGG